MKQRTNSLFKEIVKTFFFAGIILPILMMGSIGAYGLIVWLLQIFAIGLASA
ncbi:nitrate/trimethylamine N-oxide reductase NapE/TorE [Pasteurella dagmatis]|uniref:nitrate/trimethylamine N-oxide reductase NapE/TorE n=1 Tax=Pasteurella dagmatis TaxID=754 RepID=UPI0009D69041|nr:nitrate/trimethylamine N-oxide reductase NapE/TorE [Pasteurella dagmatis]SNV83243.1 Periplasmic nitrate reductase system, NapE component [Pasteurella dagmatis]